jgi:MoaA/NifB/PqqE/SkfB family radical SAM enzyme
LPLKPRLDVHLYVTPVCNLTCPHCYYDALIRKNRPADEMSAAAIADILAGLCDRYDADISLEGGEIFLRPGIESLLERLRPEVLETLTITTNGTLPIKVRPGTLRAVRDLRVSVDGHTDELQRELRGVSLRPVLQTCARLVEQSVPFTIRTTLWSGNVESLADMLAWADRNRFERLSLFEFQASGRCAGTYGSYGLSDEQFDGFMQQLLDVRVPDSLRLLKVNFAAPRVAAVQRLAAPLGERGIAVQELAPVANCTINYNGEVGISPWRVTAGGAPDVFANALDADLFETITRAMGDGRLEDRSGSISRVQLRFEAN